MVSEPLLEKRGAVINKKNLDSSISLPTAGFPLTNVDIHDVAVSKLTGGVDQNVVQNNAGNITIQDLIIATKQVDNTVIPSDGWVLTYDNASGKVKFKASTNTALSEVQFLASQAALGNLILATGNRTSTGVLTSYTPANGKTFTLYQASVDMTGASVGNTQADLRNNGTIRDTIFHFQLASNTDLGRDYFIVKGDQLIGDGVKIYDINYTSGGSTNGQQGSLEGYIA